MQENSSSPDLIKLRLCFQYLNEDLARIKYLNPDKELPHHEHAINSIIEGGILGCNEEDSQEFIWVYLNEIEELKKEVPVIIQGLTLIKPSLDFHSHDFRLHKKIYESKEELQKIVSERLVYYEVELNKILSRVGDKLEKLGVARFAPAGFKIKLNLNNQDLAGFFNALYDSKLIIQEKEDGSILTKAELVRFINMNFSSNSKEVIKTAFLTAKMSSNIPYSSTVEKEFKRLLDFVTNR
jgi:hypothetical protein